MNNPKRTKIYAKEEYDENRMQTERKQTKKVRNNLKENDQGFFLREIWQGGQKERMLDGNSKCLI